MLAMNKSKQQFNIYLNPELIAAMKHCAVDEQLSLSDLTAKILAAYLKGTEDGTHQLYLETPADRPR